MNVLLGTVTDFEAAHPDINSGKHNPNVFNMPQINNGSQYAFEIAGNPLPFTMNAINKAYSEKNLQYLNTLLTKIDDYKLKAIPFYQDWSSNSKYNYKEITTELHQLLDDLDWAVKLINAKIVGLNIDANNAGVKLPGQDPINQQDTENQKKISLTGPSGNGGPSSSSSTMPMLAIGAAAIAALLLLKGH